MSSRGVETAEPASQKVHTVSIENMRFSPAELTVRRGERIVWINKDLLPHTVTARSEAFDSGNIPASASWSYVAAMAGDYLYVCAFHPTMKAKLTVQ
jgi:plastocyanin